MTAFMRTSLPAWERSFPSHPCNFLYTLSLIQSKLALFPFPVKEGNPKYFSQRRISRTPRIPLMVCLLASVTDLLKNRAVLSLLIFQPETSSYTDSKSITLLHPVELALQNRRLSSAKKQMGQFRSMSAQTKSRDISIAGCLVYKAMQALSTQEEQEW